jgi:hypothetical protein
MNSNSRIALGGQRSQSCWLHCYAATSEEVLQSYLATRFE